MYPFPCSTKGRRGADACQRFRVIEGGSGGVKACGRGDSFAEVAINQSSRVAEMRRGLYGNALQKKRGRGRDCHIPYTRPLTQSTQTRRSGLRGLSDRCELRNVDLLPRLSDCFARLIRLNLEHRHRENNQTALSHALRQRELLFSAQEKSRSGLQPNAATLLRFTPPSGSNPHG